MNRDEILKFINENPACHLATVEGDAPRVRGMLMYRADRDGLIFQTGEFKELVKQIQLNPKVEVCFNNFATKTQVRIRGTAEFLEDRALKEEIVRARAFLKTWVESNGYEKLKVFRVKPALATVWTMAATFEPNTYIKI